MPCAKQAETRVLGTALSAVPSPPPAGGDQASNESARQAGSAGAPLWPAGFQVSLDLEALDQLVNSNVLLAGPAMISRLVSTVGQVLLRAPCWAHV